MLKKLSSQFIVRATNTPIMKSDMKMEKVTTPVSVNFHFTRLCNFNCYFCFHTNYEFELRPLEEAKAGLRKLAQSGMEKVNLTGGEPLLHKDYLTDLLHYCKDELEIPCTSIVTNGSLVDEDFLFANKESLDLIGVSIDSFNPETLKAIGRKEVDVFMIRELSEKYDIAFKINTVVNRKNHDEDMNEEIHALSPCRWKVLQVTTVEQENLNGKDDYSVSSKEYEDFVQRHQELEMLVAEPSNVLTDSYLILDERLRFLNCKTKEPGESILEVSMEEALEKTDFNQGHFDERGGKFW